MSDLHAAAGLTNAQREAYAASGELYNGKPVLTVDEAAAQIDRGGFTFAAEPGTGAVVTYGFRADAPNPEPNGVVGFEPFTAAEIAAAKLSFLAMSDVANLTFIDAAAGTGSAYSDNAQILLSNADSLPGGSTETGVTVHRNGAGSGVFISSTFFAGKESLSPGGFEAHTISHELGHAVGFSHPSDYNAGQGDISYAADASYAEDSRQYSIMSYFNAGLTSGGPNYTYVPDALQLDDIAALQRLYGANTSTRSGDTTYGFHSNTDRPWYSLTDASQHITGAIWDGGGHDTLDFSQYTQDQLIDLRQGDFSNVGGDVGNISIAIGAQIEDAIGGSGADLIYGNTLDNSLDGGAGDDTLAGGGGADTLDGGTGTDTANFDGFSHDYALSLSGGAGGVSSGERGVAETLTSIEDVKFLDGELTFDAASLAAQIVRLYDSFVGRAPDTAGFVGYLRFAEAGHSLQDMAANAAASPEFLAATSGLSDEQFVTYVYEHSLHREPDQGGLQTYVADLENGTFTRDSLIAQAAESPEHIALTTPLVAEGLWIPDETVEGLELLYHAAVQRQPDAYGLAQYGAEVAQGTSFHQIALQIAGSAEFQEAHDGQDDAAFVDSLYVAELARHADTTGLAAYTDQLSEGATRGDILYETAFSAEHQSQVLAYSDPLLG